jgi:methylmalonyl-CoA/ethylmalonyl-CoA epimerase
MFVIKKIDHVAVCVEDVDVAAAKYKAVLGLDGKERELVVSQSTDAMLLPIGDSNIELISPRGNEGLARFLAKRGPGIHHIALEVEGIEAALAFLKAHS